jgi:diguanylate cyclase (GGDEF)-like protein
VTGNPGPKEPDPRGRPADAGPRTEGLRVLLMNHHRDPLDDLEAQLRRSGYDVVVSHSLAETRRALDQADPAVVILNPLIVKQGGVEFELLEHLQSEDRPVPVILLIDGLPSLAAARHLAVPFRDFVMKPHSLEECMHRVELAALTRSKFMALHDRARELEGQVSIDFKTELISERSFHQILQIEFKRAQRHHTPLSLLLLDVDDFKGVNDSTEYEFGDEVLRHVAQSLKRNIRENDFAARFGGDEFVLLLPHTTPAEAVQTAIRIRKKVSSTTVRSEHYQKQVTVSIGIDTYDGRGESSPDELRRRANKALQEAKQRGKNQVWLYSQKDQGLALEP